MITITLILLRSANQPETVQVSMDSIPSIHEFVKLGGIMYRVEDVTHDVETKGIEVRAVA